MTFRLSHLAALLAVTIVAAAVGGVVATYRVADEEFRDVLDEDLENQSELLAELLTADGVDLDEGELQDLLDEAFEPEGKETLWVNVYNTRTGVLVSNFKHDISLGDRDRESVRLSFNGHHWRGYQSDEDHVVVQLLRRDDLYREVQGEILEDIVAPTVIGSAINLLLLALLIGMFLWPLTRLARQLETRSAQSLAPVALKTPAREVQVLRDALNNLFQGVDSVLTRERQFASDVAHELRTPLTTLTLELAGTDPDLHAARAEVDRLARLVEQLLTLARLEQGQWHGQFEPLQLAGVFSRVLDRFGDKFRQAGMTLESHLSPAEAAGDIMLLEILLRNLLDNVLVHCQPKIRADVWLDAVDGRARLRVSDTGPGIPEETRRRMSGGFTHLDSKSEGFGLGLAICHKIAEVHGATLAFLGREDEAPGLRVEIVFPRLNEGFRKDG
ncbi:MAG: ATP-binding protein [Woeseiaceae bacterium]